MNNDHRLKCEALWVICNTINSAETGDLIVLVQLYQLDLIETLAHNLANIRDSEPKLVNESLDAFIKLINLDKDYKVRYNREGYRSIIQMIEACRGFDCIEDLQYAKNEQIVKRAQDLTEQYV